MYLGDWLQVTSEGISKDSILELIESVVFSQYELVKDLIRSQWEAGENMDGLAVGFYTEFTEKLSNIIGDAIMPKVAGEPYNLLWTGSLFEQIRIEFQDLGLNVDSASDNETPLFERISENAIVSEPYTIYGLNTENLEILLNSIQQDLIEEILIKLKMQ